MAITRSMKRKTAPSQSSTKRRKTMRAIERAFPIEKRHFTIDDILSYRLTREDFDTFQSFMQNTQYRQRYELWKNYTKTRERSSTSFNVKLFRSGFKYNIIITRMPNRFHRIPFIYIEKIKDVEKYLQRTEEIVEVKNRRVDKWNSQLPKAIRSISDLKDWNDYVVLYEKKYGLPHILNEIHRTNNCNGKVSIDLKNIIRCKCRKCATSNGLTNHNIRKWNETRKTSVPVYYRCNACNALIKANLEETLLYSLDEISLSSCDEISLCYDNLMLNL